MKMNRKRLLLTVVIAATALAGCELLVDFDRTKIPGDVDTTDGGIVADAEAGTAVDVSDAGDAGDAAVVPGTDGGDLDSGPDAAPTDAGTDAASDASADAGDGGDGGDGG